MIRFNGSVPYQLSVRISGNQTGKTLTYIEETWNSFIEQQPVHMTFLEEDLAALYNNDEKTATDHTHSVKIQRGPEISRCPERCVIF